MSEKPMTPGRLANEIIETRRELSVVALNLECQAWDGVGSRLRHRQKMLLKLVFDNEEMIVDALRAAQRRIDPSGSQKGK